MGSYLIELVLVVFQFQEVFYSSLHGMPQDRDIYFLIELELCTKPNYIPPY